MVTRFFQSKVEVITVKQHMQRQTLQSMRAWFKFDRQLCVQLGTRCGPPSILISRFILPFQSFGTHQFCGNILVGRHGASTAGAGGVGGRRPGRVGRRQRVRVDLLHGRRELHCDVIISLVLGLVPARRACSTRRATYSGITLITHV